MANRLVWVNATLSAVANAISVLYDPSDQISIINWATVGVAANNILQSTIDEEYGEFQTNEADNS